MRPLQLTLTAFGPYAGTETVDFDALSDLGLFVVAGANGAGKTTIFDALHFALYGRLPGRRANYARLKSDHASARAHASVVLDFLADGHRWRVERSPKQSVARQRGDGMIEREQRAKLFRIDLQADGTHVPVATANKIGEVNERCAELVGLSSRQFERVALLPQGEFSRVLQESRADRTKLLRTLFSSEVFERATQLLIEQARQSQQTNAAELAAASAQLTKLANEFSSVLDRPVADDPAALAQAVADYDTVVIAPLRARRVAAHEQAQTSASALQIAQAARTNAERRATIHNRLIAHRKNQAAFDQLVIEVDAARSAVPVAQAAERSDEQFARRSQVEQRCAQLQADLRAILPSCDLELPTNFCAADLRDLTSQLTVAAARQRADEELRDQIAQITSTIAALDDRRRATVSTVATVTRRQHQLAAKLAVLQDQLGDGSEPDVAAAQREHAALSELVDKRRQLHQVRDQLANLASQRDQLEQGLAQATDELRVARQAADQHQALFAASQAAVAALEQLELTARQAQLIEQTTAALPALQANATKAEQHAESVWQRYLQSTAPRLAAELTDQAPCPVCGSCEHPAPAVETTDGELIDHAQVTTARRVAESEREQLTVTQQRLADLITANPHAAEIAVHEFPAELDRAKRVALAAQEKVDENHRTARAVQDLELVATQANEMLQALVSTERTEVGRENQLLGSLGHAADEPLDQVEHRAQVAAQELSQATLRQTTVRELREQRANLAVVEEELSLEFLHADGELSRIEALLGTEHDRREKLQAKVTSAPAGEQHTNGPELALQLLSDLETQQGVLDQVADTLRRTELLVQQRLDESPFASLDQARAAARPAPRIAQLDHDISDWNRIHDQLQGQLHEIGEVDELPEQPSPSLDDLESAAARAAAEQEQAQRLAVRAETLADRWASELTAVSERRAELAAGDPEGHALTRVAGLVRGDNDRNTSLENWVLAAHLRDVVAQANLRLARSTQQRFQLCVLDDGESRKGTWGLDLAVEDTVTGTRRPTEGLSGGELFQASLALALGLADVVMADSAGVRIDALFIDEGFGSLDQISVERAIDLLDELRGRGAMVGVITHVPALLEALPRGVTVTPRADGMGSTLSDQTQAA